MVKLLIIIVSMGLVLTACKKNNSPVKAQDTSASSTTGQTKESRYINNLNKDTRIKNPDALLDEVNQQSNHAL